MAGTIKGKIDCFFETGDAGNTVQEMFVSLYNFLKNLETAGYCSEHALWHGSGGLGANMNYHDVANPAGSNAWAVFKWPAFGTRTFDFYIHIQWSDGAVFGNAGQGGALALIGAGIGQSGGNLGIQMAIGIAADGTTPLDPWNGTTVGGGADTKGTPVWVPGVGSVHAFPRSNNALGTHATNRENHWTAYTLTSGENLAFSRAHFVADRDGLGIFIDRDDNNTYSGTYCGFFEPKASGTYDNPAVMICDSGLPFNPNVLYGATTGSSTSTEGGILMPDVTAGVKGLTVDRLQFWENTDRHPSRVPGFSGEYDIEPVVLNCFEAGSIGRCGRLEFIKEVYNIQSHNTNLAADKVVLGGSTTLATTKVVVPWVNSHTPRTNFTRVGVDF